MDSVRVRILGTALLVAIVAISLVSAVAAFTLNNRSVSRTHDARIPPQVLAACAARPEAWRDVRTPFTRYASFPADSTAQIGSSVNNQRARSLDTGDAFSEYTLPVTTVIHRTSSTECQWMKLEMSPPRNIAAQVFTAAVLGALVSVFLAVLGTYALVLSPLLARIRAIRRATSGVGTRRYTPSQTAIRDDLADIWRVLDDANARINRDRDELLRRHQALEQHMAELAHDLRTPLQALLLGLQEAEASGSTVGAAIRDAEYVASLVENLHEATRLRHGLDPSVGRTDLSQIVDRLEVRFRILGQVRGVDVRASVSDGPVWVRCDPNLAERAIGNLLHNAIDHARGHVAAVLFVRKGGFTLTVTDDGDGVGEPEMADLALRTFSNRPERPRGSGLGLAITNEVVRRSGWSIDFAAAEDGGLSVRIAGGVDPD